MPTVHRLAAALVAPERGLRAIADRRRFVAPLVAATAISLGFAAVLVPRADFERAATEALERRPDASDVSPHDREVALAQARKVGTFTTYAAALLEPAARALVAALCTWMAFRLAAARVPFLPTFAVMSWAFLPLALRTLLTVPALLRMDRVAPDAASAVLPSSLATAVPATAPLALRGLAGGLDLFALWALVLAGIGMAQAARVSRARALTIVAALFAAFVLLHDVALPGFRAAA